jgi:hypothetical protein
MKNFVQREKVSVLDVAKRLHGRGLDSKRHKVFHFQIERQDVPNDNTDETMWFIAEDLGEAMIACANRVQNMRPTVIGFRCILIQEPTE